MINSEQDIINLVKNDAWMMSIVEAAKTLHLPDWWVCAGFIRSKVWDTMHGYSINTHLPDIDVVYYDPYNDDEDIEKLLESRLKKLKPTEPWSVKNQARMHILNGESPYKSTLDAVSRFPETATSIAMKLNEEDELILAAPWGLEDLLALRVKPTPPFKEKETLAAIYERRLREKEWNKKWPKVSIYGIDGELLKDSER